jgi:hypothetical protein
LLHCGFTKEKPNLDEIITEVKKVDTIVLLPRKDSEMNCNLTESTSDLNTKIEK